MSIKGGAYARFQRALQLENPLLIRAAAAELPALSLADALRVTLVLLRHEPAVGRRAAVRWIGRLALETPELLPGELVAATCALQTAESEPLRALDVLAALTRTCGREDLREAVERARAACAGP